MSEGNLSIGQIELPSIASAQGYKHVTAMVTTGSINVCIYLACSKQHIQNEEGELETHPLKLVLFESSRYGT